MASQISHPQLTDFYTQTAACKDSSPSPAFHTSSYTPMQGFYSLIHTLHPKFNPLHPLSPPASAPAPLHDYNLSSKPFVYSSSNVLHGLSKGNATAAELAEEPSSVLSTHATSTLTSISLDDQVSSPNLPLRQEAAATAAATECRAPPNAGSPHLAGGLGVHGSSGKKRIRTTMDCKDPQRETSDAKKRSKTNDCEAHQRRKGEPAISVQTVVKSAATNTEKFRGTSPLKQGSPTAEQKSPVVKSNVPIVSSPVFEQESPTKPDYIHVRARRGQATDSHSLAERVRREKISERMKYLQDLVPSCIKVTGKAMMLDEIINYVQSLQRQVEFLSMKLAAVPPSRLEYSFDSLFGKKEVQSNQLNGSNTLYATGAVAAMQAAFAPPADYANNAHSSFINKANMVKSNDVFLESARPLHDVNSGMQLHTPNDELGMACSPPADLPFFGHDLPSDLGVEDALVHHSAAGSTNCSLVASPITDAILNPVQHSCISQNSQLEMEWDDDLQNIVQQMGCLSQVTSSWLPADHLLTEGFFLQGNLKEEL